MLAASLADSVLAVVAVSALAAAALRLASTLASRGLPRLLTAVSFAAATAVLEALALGLIGLSGSAIALTLLSLALWVLIKVAMPAPDLTLHRELADGLRRGRPASLAGLGAVGGLLLAVLGIELRRPLVGQDAITYHLPEVVGFVQSGHAGRTFDVFYGLPVGNYPLTQEVLLSWGTGLTHGFAAAMVMTVGAVALLLLAGWLGLAELEVPVAPRVLALGAFALVPLVLGAWTQPGTDLAATTWLVCCGALCLAARRSPGLLAGAVVAGGLGIGTKTTVISWVLVMLAVTAWFQRAQLRQHLKPLIAALLVAVLTGLIWYLRNWAGHGSPLWPFSSFPGGDPRPQLIDFLSTSLLESLQRTLLDHLRAYSVALSGGVVLILAGVAAALPAALVRRRRLLVVAVVVAAGAFEYAAGPVTGLPPRGLALVGVIGSTLRYLMPVFAAGTVALALTAADRDRRLAAAGWAALLGALTWDLISDIPQGFHLPYDTWLWPGIALGALLLPSAAELLRRSGSGVGRADPGSPASRIRPRLPFAASAASAASAALAAIVAVGGLTAGAVHFVQRNAATRDFAVGVEDFLLSQPGYVKTRLPVATAGSGLGLLAGDRLQHRLVFLPQHASCATVVGQLEAGWVVSEVPESTAATGLPANLVHYGTAAACLHRVTPVYDDGQYEVFAPLKSPPRVS